MPRKYGTIEDLVIGELNVRVVTQTCWLCKGEGEAWYSVYHNDKEKRPCNVCQGTGQSFSHYEVDDDV